MGLTCGARAWSVVMIEVVRTQHRQSAEIGLVGGVSVEVESPSTSRDDGNLGPCEQATCVQMGSMCGSNWE